jgi:hypothetical protein
MDELVKLVAKKAGVSQDQAKDAVNTVIGYLKQNLPAPVAGQIDAVLSGGGDLGSLTKAAGSLGTMFGGKK